MKIHWDIDKREREWERAHVKCVMSIYIYVVYKYMKVTGCVGVVAIAEW